MIGPFFTPWRRTNLLILRHLEQSLVTELEALRKDRYHVARGLLLDVADQIDEAWEDTEHITKMIREKATQPW